MRNPWEIVGVSPSSQRSRVFVASSQSTTTLIASPPLKPSENSPAKTPSCRNWRCGFFRPTRNARPMRTIKSHLIFAAILLAGFASIATSQAPISSEFTSEEGKSMENPTPLGWKPPVVGAGDRGSGSSVQADHVGAAGDMIGFSHADGSAQTITLVDTRKSWMAVYHIDRSGEIRLVSSSRPLDADFSLQLNATSPLPDEIRGIGRARK